VLEQEPELARALEQELVQGQELVPERVLHTL
jgi:hypothetical protein